MAYNESEVLELKQTLNKDFAKAVVAFLNTRDGTILIGVSSDGKVIGVDDVDKKMRDIRDIIKDQILPSTEELYSLNTKVEEGKTIIVVKVFKGEKLFYIKKEGRSSRGCFYRDGTTSAAMSEEQIEKRFISTYIKPLSMVETPTRYHTLSFRMLRIYYESKGLHLSNETFEKNLSLRTSQGEYNYLAELMSDENRVSIKVARFRGKDKSDLIEKSEYGYQCLLVAIDRVINRLEAVNITKSKIVGARRVDTRLMDMGSLREAFINAIVHNDWSRVEPAVYIFSDRVDIISYGGLPEGQTKDMFFKGVSAPRNKELMRILLNLEYVEQTGFGVPEILKYYDKEIFDINDNYIIVSIPYNPSVLSSLTIVDNGEEKGQEKRQEKWQEKRQEEWQEKLFELIKKDPKISLSEIAKELNVSVRTTRTIIDKSKRIVRVGPNKGGYWELIDE